MSNNNKYPKWYINAKRNEDFFKSDEYKMLLQDAITEYNNAIEENNQNKIEKWKSLINKWLRKAKTNRYMIMQFEGGIN